MDEWINTYAYTYIYLHSLTNTLIFYKKIYISFDIIISFRFGPNCFAESVYFFWGKKTFFINPLAFLYDKSTSSLQMCNVHLCTVITNDWNNTTLVYFQLGKCENVFCY